MRLGHKKTGALSKAQTYVCDCGKGWDKLRSIICSIPQGLMELPLHSSTAADFVIPRYTTSSRGGRRNCCPGWKPWNSWSAEHFQLFIRTNARVLEYSRPHTQSRKPSTLLRYGLGRTRSISKTLSRGNFSKILTARLGCHALCQTTSYNGRPSMWADRSLAALVSPNRLRYVASRRGGPLLPEFTLKLKAGFSAKIQVRTCINLDTYDG